MTVDEGSITVETSNHILLMGLDPTDDAAEGVGSFVERREATFVGR